MIPLRDDNPSRTLPIVTVGLIAINVLVAIYTFIMPPEAFERVVFSYGAIPLLLARDLNLLPQFPSHWLTLVSSMFLHGGIAHLVGNMLYLWIFGNNVEDHLGHVKFLFFYLACGIVAALAHALAEITSTVPMVGASGAISGVLGAYLVLYPHARVVTLIWFFFLIRFVPIPAYFVLGVWFVMQLSGVLSSAEEGGIAWFAHIGGFIIGVLLIFVLGNPRRTRARFT